MSLVAASLFAKSPFLFAKSLFLFVVSLFALPSATALVGVGNVFVVRCGTLLPHPEPGSRTREATSRGP